MSARIRRLNAAKHNLNSSHDLSSIDLSQLGDDHEVEQLVGLLVIATIVFTVIGFILGKNNPSIWEVVAILWISVGFIAIGYLSKEWSKRPKYFTLYLLNGYASIVTLFYLLTNAQWVKTFSAVICIIFWFIIIIWELIVALPLYRGEWD